MSELSETESARDLEAIDVVVEVPDASLSSNQESAPAETTNDGARYNQILLSSAYLDDACNGHHMEFEPTVSAVNLYNKFKSWYLEGLIYLVLITYLSLALFEDPGVIELPFYITVIVEFFCLTFFLFRLGHEYLFSKKNLFWQDGKHIVQIIIVALAVVDICVYTGLVESGIQSIRISRPFRPFLIVNIPEGRQVRRAFRNIRRTLPEISSVLLLFGLILAVFALMAAKIFGKRGWKKATGGEYFPNFGESYWDLYVLVTTANNPDIMMPAYNANPWLSIFFIVFIVICLYIFMSIFLAVVYNNYRWNLKNEVQEAIVRKRELVTTVFDLLKTSVPGHPGEVITKEEFKLLIKKTVPRKSEQYAQVVWCVLDVDENGYVDRKEFMCIADLLNIPVTEVLPNLFERYIPGIYGARYSNELKVFVKRRFFRYFFDAIIIINAFFILFELDGFEWGFLFVFIVEILLKIYSFGFYMFIRKLWNIFDLVVIGAAFLISIAEEFRGDKFDSGLILDVMLVLRVLRFVKIFHSLNRFKTILNTIRHILPSMLTYAGVLFVFAYFFAIIGMEAFKGRITFYGYDEANLPYHNLFCGNPNLENSEFYRQQYCANNFNNILRSFVTLSELLVVNQWHILAEGFELATGSKYTRIFFISFHLLSVIIILNIFTAFVLEVFILEYSYSKKGSLETTLETKINEMGLGLGSKPLYRKQKPPAEPMRRSIIDEDELEQTRQQDELDAGADTLDADHDNLQFVSAQLEDMTKHYKNRSKDTAMRFHLRKGGKNVHTLLEKLFINEMDVKVLLDGKDLNATEFHPDRSSVFMS